MTIKIKTESGDILMEWECPVCKEQKWTSVEDRLPDDQQIIFILIKNSLPTVSRFTKDSHDYLFMSLEMNFQYKNVTHWMSIPEPPEDKND